MPHTMTPARALESASCVIARVIQDDSCYRLGASALHYAAQTIRDAGLTELADDLDTCAREWRLWDDGLPEIVGRIDAVLREMREAA